MEQPRLKGLLPFPSIRTQLLIISLVVLVLPWIGVQTIRDMENLLREQQVHSVKTSATAILGGLSPAIPLLIAHNNKLATTPVNSEVFLSTLVKNLTIDGYADDWPKNRVQQTYNSNTALRAGIEQSGFSFDLSAYHQSNALILLLDVTDNRLYQTDNPVYAPLDGDHLLLGIGNNKIDIERYIISSNAPGWLSVIPVTSPDTPETRIQAEMQVRTGGYTIEISIPDDLAGQYLSVLAIDRDNKDASHAAAIGNIPVSDLGNAGLLYSQSSEIKQQLAAYRSVNQRLTLVDTRGNILATDGDSHSDVTIQASDQRDLLDRLHEILLLADVIVGQEDNMPYRIEGEYIQSALNNQADYIFTRDAEQSGLLSVAIPITIDNQSAGALVVQQSTQAISTLRHRALFKIMLTSLSAMAIVILVLLLYATVLIKRIRALNGQMQRAANDDGRLDHGIRTSLLDDEIGELNRGMANMVGRLQAYQQYLETMASKLSHEMRTPLTVVQSSLENLQSESETLAANPLITRANEGLNRLKMILSNLTEASRLENILKSTEAESFNLPSVIKSCVMGYQLAYSDITFEFSSNTEDYTLHGSADLIAQLLDKLANNAVDFHSPGSPINISINENESGCELCVRNIGQPVPDNLLNTLFDSMISARTNTSDTPHMGLGLYIVRLIAKFHSGTATISNEDNGVSVRILFSRK